MADPDSTPPSDGPATSGGKPTSHGASSHGPPAPPSIEGHPDSVGPELGRLQIGDHRGAIRLDVTVKPRSSRSSVLGVREGALEVALRAAPAEGAANDELRALLARALDVRRSDVTIVLGASSRGKVVEIHGVGVDEARARLARAKR